MEESKKYWYIQLNVNFFEDERIDWLCEQQNGFAYVVLYLKLCLKTANNNGILTRQIGNMIIPYNVEKIAEITHINVDVVRVALELYKKIGLVYEADENCNFMRLPEVPSMVGCVTQAALDKRKQRERKRLGTGQCSDNVQDEVPDNVQDNVQQELRVKSIELRDKSLYQEEDVKQSQLAAVMNAYMNRIDPTPSPSSMDELKGYFELMGAECCIRAIDAALNAKASNWNYVRRVLQNKASQGVRCIADWDALESKWEEAKKRAANGSANAANDGTFRGFKARSALDDTD